MLREKQRAGPLEVAWWDISKTAEMLQKNTIHASNHVAFCTAPYVYLPGERSKVSTSAVLFDRIRFPIVAPCVMDTSINAVLFFIALLGAGAWYQRWLRLERTIATAAVVESNGGSHEDPADESNGEHEPLLNGSEAFSPDSLATRSQNSPYILSLKLLVSVGFITTIVDVLLDGYQVTHPSLPPSVIFSEPARAVADLLASFTWLTYGTVLFFAVSLYRSGSDAGARWAYLERERRWRQRETEGSGSRASGPSPPSRTLMEALKELSLDLPLPRVLPWVWFISWVLGALDLYQWAAIIYHTRAGDLPAFTFFDVCYAGTWTARYVSLLLLSISCLVNGGYKLLRRGTSRDVEASGQTTTASNQPQQGAWGDTMRRSKQLFPYVWPNTFYLRLCVFGCFICLGLGRYINWLKPMQYKVVIDALTPSAGDFTPSAYLEWIQRAPVFAWKAILLFVFLGVLQGSGGLLSATTNMLWLPVQLNSTKRIAVQMLSHLLDLSLQWHLNRKTGEVLRVMDRGTASITQLMTYILFSIGPVIADIVIAVVFFAVKFDWSFMLTVLLTMIAYITATVSITEWRTKFRREMIELDNKSRARSTDSLLNFETVKYYGAENWEVDKFEEALEKYNTAEMRSTTSLNVLNTAQNITISLGLLIGTLLCARKVVDGELTLGDFVLFYTYVNQLYGPLNWLGTYYRAINQSFIDLEKMLDLLQEHKGVEDEPNAPDLVIREGAKIEFDNVSFAYDKRVTALKNISFTVPAGKTVALVGDSGGGKSTIFRLLFRFYNVTSGHILVDGQDIRKVTQSSLRKHIGVVPQDTVLFNDTIGYNINYGDLNASLARVEEAARAAQIHERILTFPDQYETKVGERGLRLSGGEKQRVAIARTLLKNPDIILLDEATSALDTTTERQVQSSLATLCANRTSLGIDYSWRTILIVTSDDFLLVTVIAHRLSTIVHADNILVVKNGRIVEQGTHEELIRSGEEPHRLRMARKAAAEEVAKGVDKGKGEEGKANGDAKSTSSNGTVTEDEEDWRGTYYEMWIKQLEKEGDGKVSGEVSGAEK
ncbi:hypothetical protein BJ742DRAFT_4158 [Cladochytrium replicatum]|nr:hypothetical protein BJ742DRAFT_4158 [Cladochytrium replicatum]